MGVSRPWPSPACLPPTLRPPGPELCLPGLPGEQGPARGDPVWRHGTAGQAPSREGPHVPLQRPPEPTASRVCGRKDAPSCLLSTALSGGAWGAVLGAVCASSAETAGPAKPVSCPDHVTQQSRAEAGARLSLPAPGLRPTRSSAVPPRSSTDVALATCRLVSTLTGPRSLPGLERLLVLKTQLAPDPCPPHFPGSCCGDGGVSAGLGGASHGASSGNWHVRK